MTCFCKCVTGISPRFCKGARSGSYKLLGGVHNFLECKEFNILSPTTVVSAHVSSLKYISFHYTWIVTFHVFFCPDIIVFKNNVS